jgi:hypothetical protein
MVCSGHLPNVCHTEQHEPNLLSMQMDILFYMSAYLISAVTTLGPELNIFKNLLINKTTSQC